MAARKVNSKPRRSYTAPPDDVIIKNTKDAAAKINELWAQLDAEDRGRTNTLAHMIDLFVGDHDLGIPETSRYVSYDAKSNKPADVIFRVMGMLSAPLRCQYISPSKDLDDRERADRIEAHLNELYPTLILRNMERFDTQSLFWQLIGGTSYLQQSYMPAYWDKNELRRRDDEKHGEDDDLKTSTLKDHAYNDRVAGYRELMGPPVQVESIDPRMIWPVRTKAKGIIAWVKKYRVTRYEFSDAFRERGKTATWTVEGKVMVRGGVAGMEYAETADVPLTTSVDYFEYIDDHWIYYVVNDEVVDKYEHKGGVKIFPAYGLQTGLSESHLSAVGILWPVRNTLMQLDFNMTLWANKGYLEVFPALFAEVPDGQDPLSDENGKPVEFDLTPGTVKQIRGKLHNAMSDSASGTDFRALVEMQGQEVDLATISGLARGVAGAQQPGYSINQLSQAMRTLWKVFIESRELQYSAMYDHYLWMLANIVKEDSAVYAEIDDESRSSRRAGTYITIKKGEIDDYYRVKATLNPDLPIDEAGNMQLWAAMFEKGLATWEEFVRKGKNQNNPVSQLRQIRLEAMERETLPEAMKDGMALGRVRLENKILKEQGFTELNETMSLDVQKLKQARQGQQPPPEMQPVGPAADGSTVAPAADVAAGPPPTFGANPADSAPGPRMGDIASGQGLR